jgi:hypothetical protein
MIRVSGAAITADATGANAFALGDAALGVVSTWVIHVVLASGTVAILPKGIASGSGLTSANYINLSYVNRNTGAVVAGGTAITATGIYDINASGCDVFLDVDVTGASLDIYANPCGG